MRMTIMMWEKSAALGCLVMGSHLRRTWTRLNDQSLEGIGAKLESILKEEPSLRILLGQARAHGGGKLLLVDEEWASETYLVQGVEGG